MFFDCGVTFTSLPSTFLKVLKGKLRCWFSVGFNRWLHNELFARRPVAPFFFFKVRLPRNKAMIISSDSPALTEKNEIGIDLSHVVMM